MKRIKAAFLVMVVLQAVHSIEEFIFKLSSGLATVPLFIPVVAYLAYSLRRISLPPPNKQLRATPR